MTILVTGGTGRTGSAVAKLLHEANIPFLILSSSGKAPAPYQDKSCHFNFLDPSTFSNPFTKASETGKPTIEAIYLCIPMMVEISEKEVNAFIDFALTKSVKKFVLLSACTYQPPTRIAGAVHQYLMDLGGDVEYVILQPTWYMENFSTSHVPSIKGKGIVASASEDGAARWVSTDDVGAAAFRALTDKSLKNTVHVLLGPDLLTYDEVAKILTDVAGKPISHARISLDQYKSALDGVGVTGHRQQIMLELQQEMASGEENRADNGEVLKLTGKQPIGFREWAETKKAVWV